MPIEWPEYRHWLVKSEPSTFSLDDLRRAPKKTTRWDGVRNFTARNFMRDAMRVGDGVLFYHSMGDAPAIVGTCEVVRAGYPDPTAFDPADAHYDPKSKLDAPTWMCVDLKYASTFKTPVTLAQVKAHPKLGEMALIRLGRLSVQPVTDAEWDLILQLSRPQRSQRNTEGTKTKR